MRTIRVTGLGKLKLRPDTTRLTVTLTGRDKDYNEVLRLSAEETRKLKDLLAGHGFAPEDVKTLRFRIETESEGYRDRHGDYRTRFAGYLYRHAVQLDFPVDNLRLGAILRALTTSELDPEFSVDYVLADPDGARDRLMAVTMEDARHKAEVLARSGGSALGSVRYIDYCRGAYDFSFRPCCEYDAEELCAVPEESKVSPMPIEPDDIEVSDTVTVIWELV